MTDVDRRKRAVEFVKRATGATCSELGQRVAFVLDQVYEGLHHIPASSVGMAAWDDAYRISVIVPDGMATFDDSKLTGLVVLCHDELLRLEIRGSGVGRLVLWFTPRRIRSGSRFERHPTIETQIRQWRPTPKETA